MKRETEQQRAKRKALYLARATAHFDTKEVRIEAEEQWEKANETDDMLELKQK